MHACIECMIITDIVMHTLFLFIYAIISVEIAGDYIYKREERLYI